VPTPRPAIRRALPPAIRLFGTPDRRPRPIGDQRTDQSEAARDVQGNSRHCGKGGANLEEAPGQLKVAGLHADGAVSDEEFKELKTKLIFGTFRRQQSAESSETVPNAPNTYAPSATPTQQEEVREADGARRGLHDQDHRCGTGCFLSDPALASLSHPSRQSLRASDHVSRVSSPVHCFPSKLNHIEVDIQCPDADDVLRIAALAIGLVDRNEDAGAPCIEMLQPILVLGKGAVQNARQLGVFAARVIVECLERE
jgi:hypothetical protein